jgi:hypothetical protein
VGVTVSAARDRCLDNEYDDSNREPGQL